LKKVKIIFFRHFSLIKRDALLCIIATYDVIFYKGERRGNKATTFNFCWRHGRRKIRKSFVMLYWANIL